MKNFLVAIIFIVSSIQLQAEDIYNSNILGMKLGLISSPAESDSGFYLRVSEADGIKTERLFENGELRFLRTYKAENGVVTELTSKEGSAETVIRENGVVISEKIEETDQPEQLTVYKYENGRLTNTEFFSAGVLLYTDIYKYTVNGRLLDVSREYSGGGNAGASFFFSDGRLSRYWFQTGEEKNYIRFNRNGIVFSDSYGRGALNETREYGSLDSGGRWELITNSKSGETTKLLFNSEDRIVSSLVRNKDGALIEETSWKYSGGLITELKIKRRLSLEVFRYQYNESGEEETETYLKNGIIIQVTEYLNEKDYTEVLYRYGIPVLKITYKDGVRDNTEQLQED